MRRGVCDARQALVLFVVLWVFVMELKLDAVEDLVKTISRLKAEIAELKERCATCKTLARAEMRKQSSQRAQEKKAKLLAANEMHMRKKCPRCGLKLCRCSRQT